ncbi:MAG: hypothetical protein WKG03_20080 [Telluria sp.]
MLIGLSVGAALSLARAAGHLTRVRGVVAIDGLQVFPPERRPAAPHRRVLPLENAASQRPGERECTTWSTAKLTPPFSRRF